MLFESSESSNEMAGTILTEYPGRRPAAGSGASVYYSHCVYYCLLCLARQDTDCTLFDTFFFGPEEEKRDEFSGSRGGGGGGGGATRYAVSLL